jgi:hypothetical protein
MHCILQLRDERGAHQLWSVPSKTCRRLLMPPLKKGWLMAVRPASQPSHKWQSNKLNIIDVCATTAYATR